MAKTYIKIENTSTSGTYKTTLIHDYSDWEHSEMLRKTGYIEVEIGGTFTVAVPVYGSVTLTLASNEIKFPDSFPQTFLSSVEDAGGDYELAAAKADAWRIHTLEELTTAIQTRWTATKDIDFESESTSEIIST